jgi:hypothetical protein
VIVDRDLLEKYAGIYELRRSDGTGVRFEISRTDATLFLQREGRAKVQLTALSATRFVGPAEYEFFMDASGVVTHFILRGVEGENKAIRKK